MSHMSGNQIQQMADRIAEGFDPERVIVFGSHAQGSADEQSDVDFLVVRGDGEGPESSFEKAIAIRRALGDFPVACDIVVKSRREYERLRRVVNSIVYFADRYGRVVYER